MGKKDFSHKTKLEILERDGYRCGVSGSYVNLEKNPHHIFFKSQLHRPCVKMADNGTTTSYRIHRIIHNPRNDDEAMLSKAYDKFLKNQAIRRFKGKIPSKDYEELKKIYQGRYGKFKKLI